MKDVALDIVIPIVINARIAVWSILLFISGRERQICLPEGAVEHLGFSLGGSNQLITLSTGQP